MQVIVPIAGPDFATSDGIKGRIEMDGLPLIRRALESREWWSASDADGAQLTFVLLDSPATRAFAVDDLRRWYPKAQTVFISRTTRGAAFSSLAGIALTRDPDAPICIDLADILFDTSFSGADLALPGIGATALTFRSRDPIYSYLRTDQDGRFVESAEKRVISDHASAGVYFFRSASVYMRALAHSVDHADAMTHNGLFYVCPVLNGVMAQNLRVVLAPVDKVVDIKNSIATSVGAEGA